MIFLQIYVIGIIVTFLGLFINQCKFQHKMKKKYKQYLYETYEKYGISTDNDKNYTFSNFIKIYLKFDLKIHLICSLVWPITVSICIRHFKWYKELE